MEQNVSFQKIDNLSIITKINNSNLSSKEKRIVDYIFSISLADLMRLTAEQLAQQTQTSRATILRFSQKLGFKGYKSFLNAFIQKSDDTALLLGKDQVIDPNINKQDNVYQITQKIISNMNARAQKFFELIYENHILDQFIQKICSASTIYAFGAGASALAAEDLQQRLFRLGIKVQFSSDIHTQLVMATTVSEKDLAIGYSYSGATHNTILALKTALSQGANIAAIVGQSNTIMEEIAQQTIQMPPGIGHFGNDAAMARILQIILNEIIFNCLANRDDHYLKNIAKTNNMLDEYKY